MSFAIFFDVDGVDEARVEMLAKAVNKYGAGNSSFFGLEKVERGRGILDYLEQHKEIDEFVILDDNVFDFEDYRRLWERLLLTNGLERAKFASKYPAVEAIVFHDYLMKEA